MKTRYQENLLRGTDADSFDEYIAAASLKSVIDELS
jgi:hypothetical protein